MTAPLRLLQVGAGSMGRAWLRTVGKSPDAVIVGLADLDVPAAQAAADAAGLEIPVTSTVTELLGRVEADGLINVTVPLAHRPLSIEALEAGLPVICEKPAAPSVRDALDMVDASARTGRLLMISQSRRYFPEIVALKERVATLGRVGTLSCRYFKELHFPGFREEMAHPLLIDMSIHHFDQARYLTGADPVRVSCTTSNPPWSWFAGDASANADIEFEDGSHLAYAGSWACRGAETSWNGQWRVAAELGTAEWDGDAALSYDGPAEVPSPVRPSAIEIAGSLAEFVDCLRTGAQPDTRIERNVLSLAMVEAAIASSARRRVVEIAEILEGAAS